MTVQTRKNPASSLGAALFEPERIWLWTWSGKCFGYREGDDLFTLEGLQVGRFAGREVYGWDGRYLGEIGPGEDAMALVTNLYKRSRTQDGFRPVLVEARTARAAQPARPLYAGHEDFPSMAALLEEMGQSLPVEIHRALRSRRSRGTARATSH